MDKKSNVVTSRLVIKQENSLLFRSSKSEKRSDAWKAYKRAALLQHPLLVDCLKAWWNVMDPHGLDFPYSFEEGTRGHLSKEQYLDLNVRLQKALNDDFSLEEACRSAEEDWKVDVQDWSEEQSANPLFTFDKFSDFFYDIAEEWSIRSILILVNGLLLHLTVGVHLNTSVFKDVDEITRLPVSVLKELQRPASDSEDFAGWYKKHFGNLKIEQQAICTALFRAFPGEARIKDIWLAEVADTQSEMLLQCIRRLENMLNKIEQPPVNALLQSNIKKPSKVPVSAPEREKVPIPPPKLPTDELEHRSEPIQLYNRTIFQKEVKLAMVGRSVVGEPRQEPPDERKEVSVQIRARIPGHRAITTVQASEKRIVFTRSKSVIYDPDIGTFHRKVQTPQHVIGDAEYSPRLHYTRADVKFHRLGKDWRSGKFIRQAMTQPQPELGCVNERSSEAIVSDKRQRARELIYGREGPHPEEKNESVAAEIDQMVGLRTPLPSRENLEPLHTSPIQIEVKKVDVPVKRKTGYDSVKPVIRPGRRGLTFENYGHLIKGRRPKKVEFNNNLEFLCHLNRAKQDFNMKHRSIYLRNTNPNKMEYISRRDELGGCISDKEWTDFISRLERLIRATRRKRRLRRNRRRKRRHVRDRLFRNVFIRKTRRDEREEYLKKMEESVTYSTRGLSLGLQKIVEDSVVTTRKNKPATTSVVRTHSPARYRPVK